MGYLKADKSLDAQVNFHAHIFSNLHEAIMVLNQHYIITYWNHRAEAILGWSASEAVGRKVEELLKPAFPDLLWSAEIHKILNNNSYEGFVAFTCKDNSLIYTVVHAKVLRNDDGEVEEIIASIWDSTKRKEAYEKLKRSSEQIAFQANLLSVVNEAIVAIDQKHVVTYWNNAAQNLYGWTAAEVVGRKLREIYCSSNSDPLNYDAIRKMLLDDCWHGEAVHYNKDGKPMQVEAYTKVLSDQQGEFQGVITAVRDITNRKKSIQAMRLNEETKEYLLRLSDSLKQLEDPAHIQDTAACVLGSHLRVDRAIYCEVVMKHGREYYNIEHLYHVPESPLPLGLQPICNYGIRANVDPGTTKVVRDIETEPLIDEAEYPLYRKLKLRAWIRVPLIKNDKYVACFVVHQGKPRDWTPHELSLVEETAERTWAALERARAQKALRYNRRKLKAINEVYEKYVLCETLDQLGAACLELVEGITGSSISFVGEAGDDGMFRNIAISTKAWNVCGIRDKSGHDFKITKFPINGLCGSVITSGKTLLVNDPGTHPDSIGVPEGHVRIKSFLGVPYIREGEVIGIIGAANREGGYTEDEREILEALAPTVFEVLLRKRAEEELEKIRKHALSLVNELEKADSNKNEFLSTLSHELRNPLAVVLAGLQLLDMTDDPVRTRKFKDTMHHQIKQLCSLVDDLLDLTRIAHNKVVLNKETVGLGGLSMLAAEDIMPLFDEKGVGLVIRVTDDGLSVEADLVRLRQIIGNLLNNALKFTDPGGNVELSVYKQNEDAVICVKDTGIGIKPEVLENLFKPFVQADSSIARPKSGLGLGLAIVKGIAELHGGSAHAQSEGPGKGSSFYIKLPAADSGMQQSAGDANSMGKGRSLRILVIDDNRDFTDVLCSMLELFGHSTVAAPDGVEGLEKAKRLLPDVVFCDIGLPGMNGYEVARAIRAEQGISETYLIALTGYARNEDIDRAVEAGFNRHMSKPVCASGLQAVLEGV